MTSEFGKARDALATNLQGGEVMVRVQRSFHHDGKADTLLRKLHNYIEDCNVVVCLVGSRSGAGFLSKIEAAPFAGFLPAGVKQSSYTQWEFHFARHYKRTCLVYFATKDFGPDQLDALPGSRCRRAGCSGHRNG